MSVMHPKMPMTHDSWYVWPRSPQMPLKHVLLGLDILPKKYASHSIQFQDVANIRSNRTRFIGYALNQNQTTERNREIELHSLAGKRIVG